MAMRRFCSAAGFCWVFTGTGCCVECEDVNVVATFVGSRQLEG